jgi:hypothetical protein
MRQTNVIVVPLLGLAALVVVIARVGGRDRPASALERVAAHPERYDGRQVNVTGRVSDRPRRLPLGMLDAFVLSGPDGRRLLVIPAPHGVLAAVSVGAQVSVRGKLVAVDSWADDRGGDHPRDRVSIGDVAARTGAAALLEAERVVRRPATA